MKILSVGTDLFHAGGRVDGRTDRQTKKHDETKWRLSVCYAGHTRQS